MLARLRKVFVGDNSEDLKDDYNESDQVSTEEEKDIEVNDGITPGERIQGNGTITAVEPELGVGIIDGRFRFNAAKFPHLPSPLKKNLQVEYKAHRSSTLSEWRVTEIQVKSLNDVGLTCPAKPCHSNVDDWMEEEEEPIVVAKNHVKHRNFENHKSLSPAVVQKQQTYKRVSCKVTKIDPTYVTVQQSSQSASLIVSKDIFPESHFVMIGDWLNICIQRDSLQNSGRNVLDIEEDDKIVSVQWLEKSTIIGEVKTRQGLFCINDIYCPEKELTKGGKDLKVGDHCKVTYVLSDQYKTLPDGDGDITFSKRSQRVEAIADHENWSEAENILKQHKELDVLCRNKQNIVITPRQLNFGAVKVNTEIEKTFEIINKGSDRVILTSVTLRNDQSVCVFEVHIQNREGGDLKVIDGNSTIYVTVTCKPKLLGLSQEICIFDFSTFQIGRKISLRSLIEDPQNFPNIFSADNNSKKTRRDRAKQDKGCLYRLMLETQAKVKRAPSSTRHPFFLPVRLPSYPIPIEIQTIYCEEQLKGGKGTRLLRNKYPNVDWCTLDFDNYEQRFQLSLYLEELETRKLRKRLDLKSVTMSRDYNNSLMYFSVPEYAVSETRPLLSVGEIVSCFYTDENKSDDLDNKILKSDLSSDSSDDETEENEKHKTVLYQGYIYEIGSEAGVVYIKFGKEFYQNYQEGRPIDVSFQQKRINFRRQYHGVVLGKQLLGKDWLFPSDTTEVKEPKIQYVEVTEPEFNPPPVPNKTSSTLAEVSHNAAAIRAHQLLRKKDIIDKRAVSVYEHKPDIVDRGTIANALLTFYNPCLNPEQKDAVRRILRGQCRPLPYIIFGPPGTGKSVTLVEAVMQVNKLDKFSRILVTAPSNQAADLIAERLASTNVFQPGDFVRLNGFMRNPFTIPKRIKNFCADGEKLNSIAKHKIIVCTISTAGQFFQLHINPGHFTHVFIDEAGYSTEPETLIACVLCAVEKQGQIILAGDPNQLQPVLFHNSQVHKILRQSLLERFASTIIYSPDPEKFGEEIYNRVFITMLTRSYRLHDTLLAVPSRRFYNGNLISAAVLDKDLLEKLDFITNKNIPLLFHGLRDHSLQEESASWCNNQEVQQCCRYYMKVKQAGMKSHDIGIISLYRKQVEKIKLALKFQHPNDKELPKVATIQEFQGGEKSVIIISTVISYKAPDFSKLKLQGFLFSSKMFNVTVTRAKSLLLIIGDPHSIRFSQDWLDLLQHCVDLGVYVGCDLPLDVKKRSSGIPTSINPESSKVGSISNGQQAGIERKGKDEGKNRTSVPSVEYYDDNYETASAFNPFG